MCDCVSASSEGMVIAFVCVLVCVFVGVAHFLHQVDGEQLMPIGVIGV